MNDHNNNRRQSHAKVTNYLIANKKEKINKSDSTSKDDSISSIKSVNTSSNDLTLKDSNNYELTPLTNGIKSPRASADISKSKFKIEAPNLDIKSISPNITKKENKDAKINISSNSIISLINNANINNLDLNMNAGRHGNSSCEVNSVLSMFKNTSLLNSGVNQTNKNTQNKSKITNINTSNKLPNNGSNQNIIYEINENNNLQQMNKGSSLNVNESSNLNNKISENSKNNETNSKDLNKDLTNQSKFSNIFSSNLINNQTNTQTNKSIDTNNLNNLGKKNSNKLLVSVSKIMDGLNSPDKNRLNKDISFNNSLDSLNNPQAVSVKAFAYSEDKNSQFRNTMEDYSKIVDSYMNDNTKGFFSLYDGHGGNDTVLYVKEKMPETLAKYLSNNDNVETAIEMAFHKIDEQLQYCDSEKTGATAIMVYKTKDYIYCANVGDSKCFLVNKSKSVQLTFDHKCSDEKEVERIKKCGGIVFGGRVFGQLALTRAFGDYELKKYGVVATPYINKVKIDNDIKFIVLASDGVWDVTNGDDLFKLVESNDNISAASLAKTLVKNSVSNGSRDNVSCIVIKIN